MKDKMKKIISGIAGYTKKHGTYFMLMLCLLIVAVAVAFIFPTSYEDDESAQTTPRPTEAVNPVLGQNDEPITQKSNNAPKVDNEQLSKWPPNPRWEQSSYVDDSTNKEPNETSDAKLLSPPVQGSVIWAYAMDMLTYSVTLDQWTTHSGVDIECELGTSVRAVAAGTVVSVYEDSGLGVCVVIEHKNGHKTVYANLANDDVLIKEGTGVAENAIIANVGDTAAFECAEKSHLHFEYMVDDKPVNPADYVLFIGK